MNITLNDKDFPVVVVTCENVCCDDDLQKLKQYWIDLYDRKENFTFIFFFENVKGLSLNTGYKVSKIIAEVKKLPIQYLKKTIIVFKDNMVIDICRLIMSIQKPISQVFLLNTKKNDIKNCIKEILLGNIPDEKIPIFNSCFMDLKK